MFNEKGKLINVIDGFTFSFPKCFKNDIERWWYVKITCIFYYKNLNEIIFEKNLLIEL